mmetsp:Transcript_2476/g.5888  ORF Transcript_2476/g.5888 Transcript_2476/m.5888 type:complete len:541 (+) Transcript_2476:29-1651(+)
MDGGSMGRFALTKGPGHAPCQHVHSAVSMPLTGAAARHLGSRAHRRAHRSPVKAALQELMEAFSDFEASQAMMATASERGQWREVLFLHERLTGTQRQPELELAELGEVYTSAASGLIRAQQWQRALGLMGDFRKRCPNDLTYWSTQCTRTRRPHSVFSMLRATLSRFGGREQLLQLLKEVRECPQAMTSRDLSMAMESLRKRGGWQLALQVFADSQEVPGVDDGLRASAMKAWSTGQHWQQVLAMLEAAPSGEPVYEGAIAALSQLTLQTAPNPKREVPAAAAAYSILQNIRADTLSPSVSRYVQAIADARAGDPDQALQLISDMTDEELPQAPLRYRNCLRALHAAAHWKQALLLLQEVPDDPASCEEGILACSAAGKWQLAADLLGAMQAKDLSAKSATYANLIAACASAKEWRHALWFLYDVERTDTDHPIYHEVVLYGAVVTALNWERALWLLREMPGQKVHPNVITYGAVATVCNKARKFLYTMQLHQEMLQKDLVPDSTSFKLAVGACRGRLQELLSAQPQAERQETGRQSTL